MDHGRRRASGKEGVEDGQVQRNLYQVLLAMLHNEYQYICYVIMLYSEENGLTVLSERDSRNTN